MTMHTKKGIELSVNFIVTLIIAIVVFGFGVYIAQKIYFQAQEIKDDLDQKTQQQIFQVLTDTNQPFTIPLNSFDLARGQHKIVGLGVSTYGVDATDNWFISIEAATTDKGDRFDERIKDWTHEIKKITIQPNEHKAFGVAFAVPRDAEKGMTYAFNVKVCKNTICNSDAVSPAQPGQHGRLQKVYIKVV